MGSRANSNSIFDSHHIATTFFVSSHFQIYLQMQVLSVHAIRNIASIRD